MNENNDDIKLIMIKNKYYKAQVKITNILW